MKFSGALRNIPGVENYSVALTNIQGGCIGNFQEVLRHFQGGLKIFLGGRGLTFFQEGMRIFHKLGVGIFRERVEI